MPHLHAGWLQDCRWQEGSLTLEQIREGSAAQQRP